MKIRENGDYLMEIKQKGKNGKEKNSYAWWAMRRTMTKNF